MSEVDVIRHYTNLSNKNYGVDTGFYPLGSCTMKYNPKINEDTCRYDGFANLHPYQSECCTPVSYTHLDVYKRQGTNYSGWQKQENAITIQEKLEDAKMCIRDRL